jgi:hypothetical protein
MTVTPDVYIDEYGQEQVDYANAFVDDRSGRMAAIEQHNHEQDGYIREYSDGTRIHETGRLDPEVYQRFEDDWQDDETSEDYLQDSQLPPQDIQFVRDQCGGDAQYDAATAWAEHNLNPEWVQYYNDVVDSNDVESILEMAAELMELYHQRDVDEDDYTDDVEEDDAPANLTQDVYDYCGGFQPYLGMVQWAADNLPDSLIDEYDSAMNRGNPAEVKWYVDKLAEMYTSNY